MSGRRDRLAIETYTFPAKRYANPCTVQGAVAKDGIVYVYVYVYVYGYRYGVAM